MIQNGEDARIFVVSEDDPQRTLLETKITRDDGYQKQQGTGQTPGYVAIVEKMLSIDRRADTLIVWTETNGIDMALSFQEADGCSAIW